MEADIERIQQADCCKSFAFLPESQTDCVATKAGILTRSTFNSLPIVQIAYRKNSGYFVKSIYIELTAAGTVPDSHRIPF